MYSDCDRGSIRRHYIVKVYRRFMVGSHWSGMKGIFVKMEDSCQTFVLDDIEKVPLTLKNSIQAKIVPAREFVAVFK